MFLKNSCSTRAQAHVTEPQKCGNAKIGLGIGIVGTEERMRGDSAKGKILTGIPNSFKHANV